jgi:hypothetical protein
MKQGEGRRVLGRPSPAMVVAVIALIAALSGTAFAAHQLRKNSVGTRQLKQKAVTTGKLANNAVNARKVADHSLTGADINLGALGTVPAAVNAASAGEAGTVGGHAAACPGGTILIRGVCFDAAPAGPVKTPQEAADACAARGGYLPGPLELYSTRNVIFLGDGTGTNFEFTDSYYANTNGAAYSTIVVDGTGALTEKEVGSAQAHYICAYPLVR